MQRWKLTSELTESAELKQQEHLIEACYKSVINFLNRHEEQFLTVEARIDFIHLESIYNPISIDGSLNYADDQLLSEYSNFIMRFNDYNSTESSIRFIKIKINSKETLGSFEYEIYDL